MWDLNTIHRRNDALAAGLSAVEINFLAENKIYPVVGYKIAATSLERIKMFHETRKAEESKDGPTEK